jgi:hypothetical protein
MHTGEYKWYQEDLSALAEIKRDEMKTKQIKRKRLLRKYNIEEKENLNQVTEDLKQKVSAKA